jgi:oligoribonuclease NrnB/cAMP/cGMP phosphodiesterase (DHH superfamily)
MPEIVKLAGTYDTFRKKSEYDWDKEVMTFQYWLRTKAPELNDIITDNDTVEYLLYDSDIKGDLFPSFHQGKAILDYLKSRNKKILNNTGNIIETNFSTDNGTLKYTCHFVTDYLNNSSVFSDIDVYDDPDIVYMIISTSISSKNKYRISIYSIEGSTIDVSKIARAMGGGGHFHAAGFSADTVYKFDMGGNKEGLYIYSDVNK